MLQILRSDKTVRWTLFGFFVLAIAGNFMPTWVQNNLMFGMARGLAVLGLMVLWRSRWRTSTLAFQTSSSA